MINLKLVIADRKLSSEERWELEETLNGHAIPTSLGARSFDVMKNVLAKYKEESDDWIYITVDERPLLLIPKVFDLDDVYIYRDNTIKNIREFTKRNLKQCHNVFKLYLAGEFKS